MHGATIKKMNLSNLRYDKDVLIPFCFSGPEIRPSNQWSKRHDVTDIADV